MCEDIQTAGCLYLINTTTTPKTEETMELLVALICIGYPNKRERI